MNGCKAHVFGEFERLVRSGTAGSHSRGTAARLGVSPDATCVSVYWAQSPCPSSRPVELSDPALCRLVGRGLAPYRDTVSKGLRIHPLRYCHIGCFFNSWQFSL